MLLGYITDLGEAFVMTDDFTSKISDTVVARLNAEFAPADLLAPGDETRQSIRARIRHWTQAAVREAGFGGLDARQEDALVRRLEDRLLGLGFLEPLLSGGDLSEIIVNPDGGVWAIPKGRAEAERLADVAPSPAEVRVAIDRILGPLSRRASEAQPIVSAKLPRSPRLPAGARVNVVLPPIANGEFPALNVRLYEPRAVRPERLLEWGMLSAAMLDCLADAVRGHARIMIAGSTGSGKTTTLAALASFIPPAERVLLVEDPSEIFVEHPNLVSLEARPPSIEGEFGVPVGELVTTAMRMTPKWLIVGEIRTGDAALWLLRAQMSDHPGLSTVHADSPRAAVDTIALLAAMDSPHHMPGNTVKRLVARAVDLFVQVGFDAWGVRRVTQVAEVGPELVSGEVALRDLWRFDEGHSTADSPVWERVAEPTRRRR